MDEMEILNRLVSIRNNAERKSQDELNKDNDSIKIKAVNLEYGINQLIIEIQNSILAANFNNQRKHKLLIKEMRHVFYLKPIVNI